MKDSEEKDHRTGEEKDWDKYKDYQEDSEQRKVEARNVKQCQTEFTAAFKTGCMDGKGKELHTVVASATVGEGERVTMIHTVLVDLRAWLSEIESAQMRRDLPE